MADADVQPMRMDEIRRRTVRAGGAFFLVGAGLAWLVLLAIMWTVVPLATPVIVLLAVVAATMVVAGLTWGFAGSRRESEKRGARGHRAP